MLITILGTPYSSHQNFKISFRTRRGKWSIKQLYFPHTGEDVAHCPGEMKAIFQSVCAVPSRVEFCEFLAYYTAVFHVIGDNASGVEDDQSLLESIVSPRGDIAHAKDDPFVRLLRTTWRIWITHFTPSLVIFTHYVGLFKIYEILLIVWYIYMMLLAKIQ